MALRISGQLIALIGFILVCLTATFIVTALLPRLVPRDKHCDDHDVDRHEERLELGGPSGKKLRILLNIDNTAKKPGKYFYCAPSTQHLRPLPSDNVTCKQYEWRLNQFVPSITDCLDLSGESWFGGSSLWRQDWPLNTAVMNQSAFVPGDIYQQQYGGVMERYWISSAGFSVFVSHRVPLHVGINASRLCLTGSLQTGVYNLTARNASEPLLAYTVCSGRDIRSLYRSTKFWDSPTEQPDRDLFRRPIWSTWAYLKSNITQDSVLQFAGNISALGLPASQLEIDDKWSANYGDHAFDPARFPEPRRMVDALHALGLNVTLWVHPFVNLGTEAFVAGAAVTGRGGSFLVTAGENRSQPALVGWWRAGSASAALIDVTDAQGEGTRYLESRLRNLSSLYSVDSFKLDAGEANWLPAAARLAGYVQEPNPGWYSHAWARFGHGLLDRRRLEVRVGFRSQGLPVLVRAMDKDSHWGLDNGLRAMVTQALTQCLIGYSFHLPDMVGGNAYCAGPDGLDGRCLPEQELYIRWLQAAVFMPTVQLSVPPWEYGQTTVQTTKKLLEVRSDPHFVANMDAALSALASAGDPLVRPMWWLEDGQVDSADQFLLGDSILVAPVLEKGATKRKVLFPRGTWRHWFATNASGVVKGPIEQEVEVPLDSVGAYWLVR